MNNKSIILMVSLFCLILSGINTTFASYAGSTKNAYLLTQPCGSACSAVGNDANSPLVEFVYDSNNGANSSGSYIKFNNITSVNNANKYYNGQSIPAASLTAIASTYGYPTTATAFAGTSAFNIKIIGKKEFDSVNNVVNSAVQVTNITNLLSSTQKLVYPEGTSFTTSAEQITFIDKSLSDSNLVNGNNTLTTGITIKNLIGNGTILNTQARKFTIADGIIDGFVFSKNPVGNAATVTGFSNATIYNTKFESISSLSNIAFLGISPGITWINQEGNYYGGKIVNSSVNYTSNTATSISVVRNSYVVSSNSGELNVTFAYGSVFDGKGGSNSKLKVWNTGIQNYYTNQNLVSIYGTQNSNLIYNNSNVVINAGTIYQNAIYNNTALSFRNPTNNGVTGLWDNCPGCGNPRYQSIGTWNPSGSNGYWFFHNVIFNNTNYQFITPTGNTVQSAFGGNPITSLTIFSNGGTFGSIISSDGTYGAPILFNSTLVSKLQAANYVSNLTNLIDNNNDSIGETSIPYLWMNLWKKPTGLSSESYCVDSNTIGRKTDNTSCSTSNFGVFTGFTGNSVTINSTDALNTISY